MSFLTDKQTLDDLNILGKYTHNSVYSMFNVLITSGGNKLLNNLFHNLPDDHESINRRSEMFRFFQNGKYRFPIEKREFAIAENYINQLNYGNPVTALLNLLRIQFLRKIGLDKEYQIIEEGLMATAKVLKNLRYFVEELENCADKNLFTSKCAVVKSILDKKQLDWVNEYTPDNFNFIEFIKYDYQIRYSLKDKINTLLNIIYEIDLYTSVAKVAGEKNFNYANAFAKELNFLSFEGLFHPGIKDAVTNDISFYQDSNILFLTGANMAGKSTLMKAIGISIYLAHMGFPIPAKRFDFSIKDGIFTSINMADDLNSGYSHFYAEVLRVKNIAREVASNKYLVILFDELFKGTNVKDAYDATLSITEAFSKKTNSSFIISTHIMEAGESLKENGKQIQFLYLPTELKDITPVYTYKLQKGISNDRYGMMIIKNEKVIEIISDEQYN